MTNYPVSLPSMQGEAAVGHQKAVLVRLLRVGN